MKRFEWDMVGMLAFDDGTWVLHEDAQWELAAKDKLIAELHDKLERKSIVLKAAGKAFNESAVVLAEATLEALGRADVAGAVSAALRKWPREEVDMLRAMKEAKL